MANNEQIVFEKRKDLYKKHRNDISKSAMVALDPYQSDNRLNKIKKAIDNIDKNILKNVNSNIELSKGNSIDIDFSSNYAMLKFDIDNLDEATINSIRTENEKINDIKKSFFILNEQNEFINNIESEKKNRELIEEINKKIDEVRSKIQLFPQTASEDLKILDQSLSIAKTNKEVIKNELRVDSSQIAHSRDFKKLYFLSLFISLAFLLVVIIIVVLLLVL